MRLIDADALHNSLRNKQKWVVRSFYGEKINEGYIYDQVHFAIDDAPTVEPIKVGDVCKECWREGGNVIKVVRCKDCRYFHENVFGDEIGMGKPYDCLIVGHCCCEFWGRKDDGSMTQTSPEGFCSFGERRSE